MDQELSERHANKQENGTSTDNMKEETGERGTMKSKTEKLYDFYHLFGDFNNVDHALPMESDRLLSATDSVDKNSYNCLTDKLAILLDKSRRLSPKSAKKFYYAAIGISWLSVVCSTCLGILAIVFAIRQNSQLLFSFGLDSILDAISSCVVLWRFHGGNSIYSEERERRACVVVGILFIASACLLAVKSIVALARVEHTYQPSISMTLSAVNAVACFVAGFTKIFVGYMLESRVLITDSVITLTGGVMSIFTVIFATLYEDNRHLWYIDDVIGLVCSLFLMCYGLWVIWKSVSEMKMATAEKG